MRRLEQIFGTGIALGSESMLTILGSQSETECAVCTFAHIRIGIYDSCTDKTYSKFLPVLRLTD